MTTFDQVYSLFSNLALGVEQYALPSTIEEQVNLIQVGVIIYNSYMENKITMNNEEEQISKEQGESLTSDEVLLLAHCMLLNVYQRIFDEFASMISVSTKDLALKDYQYQAKYKMQNVQNERDIINNLLLKLDDFSVLD